MTTLIIMTLFGYGFFLGWWARGRKTDEARFLDNLAKVVDAVKDGAIKDFRVEKNQRDM